MGPAGRRQARARGRAGCAPSDTHRCRVKAAPADKAEADAKPEDGSGRLAKTPYAESIRLGHRLYAVPGDYTVELSLAGASSETKLAIKPPEARKPRAQPAPKLRGRDD